MKFSNPGVADIFRCAGDQFIAKYGIALPGSVRRAFAAIRDCRTSALGARYMSCDKCHTEHLVYNSCRNRNCPTCQGNAAHRWLERQVSKVIDAPYFHIVFTLPPPIARIAYANREVMLKMLMKISADTVTAIAADPKRLAAKVGGTAVLHTWNQRLEWHPHTHIIVANAGFDITSGEFKTGSETFFAPVKVLGRYFRNRFIEQLQEKYRNGDLAFPKSIAHLRSPEAFESILGEARQIDWNVYSKKPFAGPKHLLKYLSRYTHRVAIGSSRITAFNGTEVSFRYRKPTKKASEKPSYSVMKLSACEFIRRYLTHVLPRGFHRVRHFGIFANSNVKKTLEKIKHQTGSMPSGEVKPDTDCNSSEMLCPTCQTPLTLVGIVSAQGLFKHLGDARAPPVDKASLMISPAEKKDGLFKSQPRSPSIPY